MVSNLWESSLGEDAETGVVSHMNKAIRHQQETHGHLHQQTRLTAGTITNNDKLASDLSHLDRGLQSQQMGIDREVSDTRDETGVSQGNKAS